MSTAVVTTPCELAWCHYQSGDVVDEATHHDIAHQLVALGFAEWADTATVEAVDGEPTPALDTPDPEPPAPRRKPKEQ